MGTMQVMIKTNCCNSEENIDNEDEKQEPIARLKPALTKDKNDKLVLDSKESFHTNYSN